MKHNYTQTAALTQRFIAKAPGTAAVSKIFTMLLLGFFLLVSGESMGQDPTQIYTNGFSNNTGLTIQGVTRGAIAVAGGELQATTINGNTAGYNGYVVINQLVSLRANYTYRVSFQARANNQNGAANGNVSLLKGSSVAVAGSNAGTSMGGVTVARSAELTDYSISFTASSAESGIHLALYLSSLSEQNTHLYIDNLTVTESCTPVAPQVSSQSSCTSAEFILTVQDAPTGAGYRWYRADGSQINGQNGPSYSTGILFESTHYFVSRVNGNCESAKVRVDALIGKAITPKVASTENCPTGTVVVVASGASSGDSYRWYNSAGQLMTVDVEYNATNNTSTLTRKRSNEHGTYYVEIVKSQAQGGCVSDRAEVFIMQQGQTIGAPNNITATRCGAGTVTFTASGAVTGEDYLWYTSSTGGTAIFRGITYTTNTLPEGTTTFYVSKINNALGCESVTRATATATVNPILIATGTIMPTTVVGYGEPATFEVNSNVRDNGHAVFYRWYMRRGAGSYELVEGTVSNTYTFSNIPDDYNGIGVEIDIAPAGCYDVGTIYSLTNETITPLPVELMFFKVQAQTRGVNLTWATASELDNKGFEVQVSNNGRDFIQIGFVDSKVGTTSMRQDYSFLDTKAVSGTRYYRLKQIDFDGSTSFSPIKAVALNANSGKVSAYPNPFDEAVIVTLNGTESRNVQVVLVDAMGKVLQQRTEETSGNSITVDMRNVTTKGMYVLHVLDNDTKHTFKLMKR